MNKTNNLQKSKPWPQMPEHDLSVNSNNSNSININSKPPKLKNRNKEMDLKLDKLIEDKASHDDLKSLADKKDVQKLHDDLLQ